MDMGAGISQRTLLDTRDLDEARDAVGAAYCPHSLAILREGKKFHAVQRAADAGTISVHPRIRRDDAR